MADEPEVIISNQADGEVNGLSVETVRSIVATLLRLGHGMIRVGMLPEEVASAFATATPYMVAMAYTEEAVGRKLLDAQIELLPGVYEEKRQASEIPSAPIVMPPHPTPQ